MKTYSAKPSEVTRVWYVLDASQTPENMFKQLIERLTEKNWLES